MKKIVISLVVFIFTLSLTAQKKDPVLLTVGSSEVHLSEFNAIFNKNKTDEKATPESIQEYLDLYIKFKLKVREAEELGYDTIPKFKNELLGYRKQLAKPYLTDKQVTDALIKEAYERMKQDVRASHILIKLDADAIDNDTLEAYKKIIAIRKRIENGEDFAKVAQETSEDPSAKKNRGDLGSFSALHMVYPFETAAYTTPVGKVSQPFRTKFGYHIVKVLDKRPSRGTIRTAHIMVKNSQKSKPLPNDNKNTQFKNPESRDKQKIDEIYAKLEAGEDFAQLAKQFSEDKNSAMRGGELKEFNAGKMVKEYEDAAFALKNDGDYSKPFKTQFGWHIVKRLELKELGAYEEMYNLLKNKISRDSRSNKSKKALLDKIKKENNFKENLKKRDDFYKLITADEMKNGTWDVEKAKKYNDVMFGFYAADGQKTEFTQSDFAKILVKRKFAENKKINVKAEINKIYKRQVYNTGIKFKDERLPKTNEEFRLLYQEYRDGILLFDLMDEKVWSKAVKDSSGLAAFYEKNKNKYMWEKRVEATLYVCKDNDVAKNVNKLLKKKDKKGLTNDDILKEINKESQLNLSIENDKYAKGDNYSVDQAVWEKGKSSTVKSDKGITIVIIHKLLPPQPKGLEEIRGLITSDYQAHLEKEWMKELQSKYEVKVSQEVLKLVK